MSQLVGLVIDLLTYVSHLDFLKLSPKLLKYYHAFEKLRGEFEEVQVTYVSQEVNDKVDELARLATSPKPGQLKTFILHSMPETVSRDKNLYRWNKPLWDGKKRY